MKRARSTHSMSSKQQEGMTLVELMVAMVIGLLIALAAAAALLVSRQGFTAVDASSQLRDNGRFIQSLLQRLGVQAGFKDARYVTDTAAKSNTTATGTSNPEPSVYGINNASRVQADAWNEFSARTAGQLGYGSDIVVLRYQTSTATELDASSDGTMIDCAGVSPPGVATSASDRIVSILHVSTGPDGEPTLMCSRSNSGAAPFDAQPLVSGVENFQVLYGVDGVGPNNTVVPPAGVEDSIPDRYLRADQLTVAGNDPATYANWRRVRSMRIGVVIRGAAGSAIDRTSQTFYPLGITKGSAGGAVGSAFADSTNDPGTVFTPTVDGRMRQALTFTVHLRNFQGEY